MHTTNGEAGEAGLCGEVAGGKLCCVKANIKSAVSTELTRVKTALTEFGANVGAIGAMWAKIQTLVAATTKDATIDALSAAERSTATAAQFKAWAGYTAADYQSHFGLFKDQAVACFGAYSQAIKKIACDGCASQAAAWADVARWNAVPSGRAART